METLKDTQLWARAEQLMGTELTDASKQIFLEEINKLSVLMSETEKTMVEYGSQIQDVGTQLRQSRTYFYNFIIHANELIQSLPEYKADTRHTQENRELLYFDPTLGGTLNDQ